MDSTATKYRKPRRQIIIPERVAARAATKYVEDENGCWISTYSVASHGYAQIGWNEPNNREARFVVTAHRASWVHHTGEQIPEGMTIDHSCRVRRCINPSHLELMGNVENAQGGGGYHTRKPIPTDEVCHLGHTVLIYSKGDKHCRECAQEWSRRKRHRQALRRAGTVPAQAA